MKTEMLLAAALMVGFAFVPAAAADGNPCDFDEVPDEDTLVAEEGLFVTPDGEVFEDDNDYDGLQSEAGCVAEDDGKSGFEIVEEWEADNQLL